MAQKFLVVRNRFGGRGLQNIQRLSPTRLPAADTGDLYINWGCRIAYRDWVMNSNLPLDKYQARATLMAAKEVDVVPAWRRWDDVDDAELYVTRPLHHTQGRGFALVRRDARHVPSYPFYISPYFADREEYRIHTDTENVILRQKKHPFKQGVESAPCRGRKFGWRLYRINSTHADVISQAKRALKALKMDFGAVDLLRLPSGRVMVLEVNAAPGIKTESTLEAYQNWLNRLT